MINFLKDCALRNIRKKILLIYFLNLTDVIFTLFLIKTGYFLEANILMRNVIENSVLSLIIKGLLPLILILILFVRIGKASEKQLYISNIVIAVCIIYYAVINLSHIMWIIYYLMLNSQVIS